MRENYSYGANTIRYGISIGTQRLIHQIVTSSEIMDLDKMKCYLRLAGNYPISLMNLTLNIRNSIADGFVPHNLKTDTELEKLVDQNDVTIRNG